VTAKASLTFFSSASEPDEFAQWLGRHCIRGDHEVPKAGSARRWVAAQFFRALTEVGVDVPKRARGLEERAPEVALAAVWGDWLAHDADAEQ
jgi:hypothetical protein